MNRLSQSLLMAGIGIAGAAMLLDMLARGRFWQSRPAAALRGCGAGGPVRN
jgi:hypothetical protein